MNLTPAQTTAMSAFRRSNHAPHIKAILEQELARLRTDYQSDDIAQAVVSRLGALEVRNTLSILFDEVF
jgi:hypothetical protein